MSSLSDSRRVASRLAIAWSIAALQLGVSCSGTAGRTVAAPPHSTPSQPAPQPASSTPTVLAPVTTSVVDRPVTPAPLPSAVLPKGTGEGDWRVLASLGHEPVVWATTIRPSVNSPDVVASFAVFDQTRLHAALFNGSQLPGGGPWNNGAAVPGVAIPALVATFNGGFQFKDIRGGYFTEGRVVKQLVDGEATLAIGQNGRLVIGVYGVDLTNDGSWRSLRQNLPMIVDNASNIVGSAREPGGGAVYWGDNFGRVLLDLRSALCQRTDGSMMYAIVGKVDITTLADVLVAAGCQRAMELDINGRWPQFVTFVASGSSPRMPTGLDPRMSRLDRTVAAGSTKDFVALFDPSTLPPDALR